MPRMGFHRAAPAIQPGEPALKPLYLCLFPADVQNCPFSFHGIQTVGWDEAEMAPGPAARVRALPAAASGSLLPSWDPPAPGIAGVLGTVPAPWWLRPPPSTASPEPRRRRAGKNEAMRAGSTVKSLEEMASHEISSLINQPPSFPPHPRAPRSRLPAPRLL